MEQEPVELLFRLRTKLVLMKKFAARQINPDGATAENITLDDLRRTFSTMPEIRRKLQETEHQAVMNYRPKPFPGRITLFRGSRQPMFGCHDTEMGWQELAQGGVDVHRVGATHITMFREPHVQELASKLIICLEQAQNRLAASGKRISHTGETDPMRLRNEEAN
jgi:thioesterase domain-containing protein